MRGLACAALNSGLLSVLMFDGAIAPKLKKFSRLWANTESSCQNNGYSDYLKGLPMPRAVILTALPVEYLAVRTHLSNLQEEMHPQGTIYERGTFAANGQTWEVGIAEVGAGNAGAAVEAERAIAHFKPDVLLFVGIAGGIKDVAIGDVVAATKVYDYEPGKVGEQFFTRPALGQSAYALVQRARAEAKKGEWLRRLSSSPASQPRVFVAPIAAGEKVIASKESDVFNFVRASYNDAIAVEMEGFGFLSAAFAYPNIKAIVIRGISDLIKNKNADDPVEGNENERHERASHHASAFAFEVLSKLKIEEFVRFQDLKHREHKQTVLKNFSQTQATNIPRSGAFKFLGRDTEIRKVSQLFEDLNRVVITGMGGIGKTELAIQYALSFSRSFSSVCWIDARAKDIGSQIIQYTKIYFGFEKIIPDLELEEQLKFCWENWPIEKNLIIFDDVRDYKSIEQFLPPDQIKFKVLMTARTNQLGQARTDYLKLGLLQESASLELLKSIVGKELNNENAHVAEQICDWLGHLPLGIELVGRYLIGKKDKRKPSLLNLKKRLEEEGLKAKPILMASQDMTAQRGLDSAFQLSWENLEQEAKYVAFLMSLFAQAPITRELFYPCVLHLDEYTLEDIVDESLLDSHLLNYREDDAYEFHQLIKEFIVSKEADIGLEEAEECRKRVSNHLASKAREIPESVTKEVIVEYSYLIPHLIESTYKLALSVDSHNFFYLYQGLGRYYEGQGFYKRAEEVYVAAKDTAESRFGNSHINAIKINLAAIYYEQGRYSEAESLQRLLLTYCHISDFDKLVHADILNGLGLTLVEQGSYQEAEEHYKHAIQIRSGMLGDEHLDMSDSFNNLGLLYNEKGAYAEAEPLFHKAIEIRQKFLGEEHIRVANCQNNLASCYFHQGRNEEARKVYSCVLEIYEKLYGNEHREFATALNNLATVYLEEEKYIEAESGFLRVIDLQEKILGKSHPDVATTMSNLAAAYVELGKVNQAEAVYKQALKIQKESIDLDYISIGITLNNLAKLYESIQRDVDAGAMYLESLTTLNKVLDKEHPILSKVRSNLNKLREKDKDNTAKLID